MKLPVMAAAILAACNEGAVDKSLREPAVDCVAMQIDRHFGVLELVFVAFVGGAIARAVVDYDHFVSDL